MERSKTLMPQLRMQADVGFPSDRFGLSRFTARHQKRSRIIVLDKFESHAGGPGLTMLKNWMAEEIEKRPECKSAYIVSQNGDLIGGMVIRV